MIEMDDDGDITSYTYDRENRLIEAELPDSTTIEYEYGPNGDRLKRYDGTDTIYYVYDGEDVLMELDGSGTVEARYTHVPADAVGGGSCKSCGGSGSVWAIDYPLMMRRGGENYFYMKDRLGSVVGLLDSSENEDVHYVYDAFGSIVAVTGSVTNPYRFTAREYDEDTGDYYYRARTYKPETGRFMQLDPMGMVDGTNMFVYVGNCPLNYIDSYGLGISSDIKKSLVKVGKVYVEDVGGGFVNVIGGGYVTKVGKSYVENVGGTYVEKVGGKYVNDVGGTYVKKVGRYYVMVIGGNAANTDCSKNSPRWKTMRSGLNEKTIKKCGKKIRKTMPLLIPLHAKVICTFGFICDYFFSKNTCARKMCDGLKVPIIIM